jgi:hypothetical protein
MNKKQTMSLPGKLRSIKPGESIVIFPKKSYKQLMREIDISALRGGIIDPDFSYKKAMVIVDEKIEIGVKITNNKEE